jgi:hypothetical protein
MTRSSRWLLVGCAAGLMLYGVAVPTLIAVGVLARSSGSWTLHTLLLLATIAVALAGARLLGDAQGPSMAAVLIGAGLSIFTWLEIDFHLLRVAEATTAFAETAVHAAGIAIASVGVALSQRCAPSTAPPRS